MDVLLENLVIFLDLLGRLLHLYLVDDYVFAPKNRDQKEEYELFCSNFLFNLKLKSLN